VILVFITQYLTLKRGIISSFCIFHARNKKILTIQRVKIFCFQHYVSTTALAPTYSFVKVVKICFNKMHILRIILNTFSIFYEIMVAVLRIQVLKNQFIIAKYLTVKSISCSQNAMFNLRNGENAFNAFVCDYFYEYNVLIFKYLELFFYSIRAVCIANGLSIKK